MASLISPSLLTWLGWGPRYSATDGPLPSHQSRPWDFSFWIQYMSLPRVSRINSYGRFIIVICFECVFKVFSIFHFSVSTWSCSSAAFRAFCSSICWLSSDMYRAWFYPSVTFHLSMYNIHCKYTYLVVPMRGCIPSSPSPSGRLLSLVSQRIEEMGFWLISPFKVHLIGPSNIII